MKIYLLESYLPSVEFDKSSVIIALTPEACYELDKQEIKYSIIEDYCHPAISLPSEYTHLQSQWIDRIDSILTDNVEDIRVYNLRLANFYNVYFQHSVLDQLFAKCYALNKVLDVLKPSEIVLAICNAKPTSLDFTFHSSGASYYSQIIPSICKTRSIILQVHHIAGREQNHSSKAMLARLYKDDRVQSMLLALKYYTRPTEDKRCKGLRIFLPKLTNIGLDFIVDAIKRGHSVYGAHNALDDNDIFIDSTIIYTSFGLRKYSRLNLHPAVFDATIRILGNSELTSWFNGYFNVDVSNIMLSRLRCFVLDICPWVIACFKAYLEFYKEAKIDTLIMAHDVLPHESAALLAANHLGLNTICISHGDGVYSYRRWERREAQNYKVIIASNTEREHYYQRLGTELGHTVQAYTSSHRLQPQLQLGTSRKNIKEGKKVLYLAFFMAGDNRGTEDGEYPDTWLYSLQKTLVRYFATRTDYSFIFEAMPASDLLYNPIPDFINDNKFSNVLYSTKPFASWLHSVDRVICDCPSTGLYESIAAGVPVMSLYHTSWTYRQSALDCFGQVLKPFSTISEAITQVNGFLNDSPGKYIMNLGTSKDSLLDIVEHTCQ